MPTVIDEQSTSIPDEEAAAVGSAQTPEQAPPVADKDGDERHRASRSKRATWALLSMCVFAVGIAIGVLVRRNSPSSSASSRSGGETNSILSDEVDGAAGVPSSHPTTALLRSSAPSVTLSTLPSEIKSSGPSLAASAVPSVQMSLEPSLEPSVYHSPHPSVGSTQSQRPSLRVTELNTTTRPLEQGQLDLDETTEELVSHSDEPTVNETVGESIEGASPTELNTTTRPLEQGQLDLDETTGELVPHSDEPTVNETVGESIEGASPEHVEEGTVTITDSDVISSEWIDVFNQLGLDDKNDTDSEVQVAGEETKNTTIVNTMSTSAVASTSSTIKETSPPTASPTSTSPSTMPSSRASSNLIESMRTTSPPTMKETPQPTSPTSTSPSNMHSEAPSSSPEFEIADPGQISENACLSEQTCDAQRRALGFQYYLVGDYPLKGCFYKGEIAYFGQNGTSDEMASPSEGLKIRIWCDGDDAGAPLEESSQSSGNSTLSQELVDVVSAAQLDFTLNPTSAPQITGQPSHEPSAEPTQQPTTRSPTNEPVSNQQEIPPWLQDVINNEIYCFSEATYDEIDADIEQIKNGIADAQERSHFLGGIVRLAAHDFMDYNRWDTTSYGPDGCIDETHPANNGLESIWCPNCALTQLYNGKYSRLSRADFWIASSNAVIRQTSLRNSLDLKTTFTWGREDRNSCPGSGQRLPTPEGCDQVEGVFLDRMGLEWADAVALLGAHTLGRGDRAFSGHHGAWVSSDSDAQVFDKAYFEDMYLESWRPRGTGSANQDWTTGRPGSFERVMLNTDLCLAFNIDRNTQCCTRTGSFYPDNQDKCINSAIARRQCPFYREGDPRFEARDSVQEMLGGSYPNENNEPFYEAFREGWRKATTVGQTNLLSLAETCEFV